MFAIIDYLFIPMSQINFKTDFKIPCGKSEENSKLQHGTGERVRNLEIGVRSSRFKSVSCK